MREIEYKIGKSGEIILEYFYREPRKLVIPRNVSVEQGVNKITPEMRKWILRNVDIKGIEVCRLLKCYESGVMGDEEVRDKLRKWRVE